MNLEKIPRNKKNGSVSISWDEKLHLVRAQPSGTLNSDVAMKVLTKTNKIAEMYGDRVDWLIDLTDLNNVTFKARKIMVEVSRHASIRKYAFVGASSFMRVVSTFITTAAGLDTIKHFTKSEEAISWLLEDR